MTKLESMLKYVHENNKYYKELISSDYLNINSYPIITKHDLQTKCYQLLSNSFQGKNFDDLIHKTTSGSMGIHTDVYWESNDYLKSMISLWRLRGKYYGISPHSRQINFVLHRFQINCTIKQLDYTCNNNIMSFNRSSFITDNDYRLFYQLFSSFNPEWLYIQPFVLNDIIDYMEKNNLSAPSELKYIESVGEVLTDEIRQKATSFFNVPIANMYGSEEMNGIALECPFHIMHIIDENVKVECLSEEGINEHGKGNIIITNLNNYAMPLIRYLQDDIVKLKPVQKCKCGQEGKQISIIEGRRQESFMTGGHVISTYMLVSAITSLNNIIGLPILKYKFIYDSKNNVLKVYLCLSERFKNWKESIINELEKIFFRLNIVGMSYNYFFVDNINVMKFNKYKILEVE